MSIFFLNQFILRVKMICSLFKAGLFFIFLTTSVNAYNPAKFLEDPSFKVHGTISDSNTTYSAEDKWGKKYTLSVKPFDKQYADISHSILAEALNLPNAPSYPVWVKSIPQNNSNSEMIRGVLKPDVEIKPYKLRDLSGTELFELIGHEIVNFVIGNSRDNISFTGKHFVTKEVNLSKQPPLSNNNFGERIEKIALEIIDGKEKFDGKKTFYLDLKILLAKLENISEKELVDIFKPYVSETSDGLFSNRYKIKKFVSGIKKRISQVRKQLIMGLKPLDPTYVNHLQKQLPGVPKALIQLSRKDKNRSLNKLWDMYFETSGNDKKDLSVSYLLDQAQKETLGSYLVFSHESPNIQNPKKDSVPQVSLNSLNSETMVVVPVNDNEASEIARISRLSGAHVSALKKDMFPHSTKLTMEHAKKIALIAKEKNISRVFIVELPEENSEVTKFLKSQDFDFNVIDHHNYEKMNLERWQRESSLEQTADALGYKLSLTSKFIAVLDRSFIGGALDLGTDENVIKSIEKASRRKGTYNLKPFSTSYGPFYILENAPDNIAGIVSYLTRQHYPVIPNVLFIYDKKIRFSGSPKFRYELSKLTSPFENFVGSHFHGGDPHRAEFWGVRDVVPKGKALIVEKILQKIAELNQNAVLTRFSKNLESDMLIISALPVSSDDKKDFEENRVEKSRPFENLTVIPSKCGKLFETK